MQNYKEVGIPVKEAIRDADEMAVDIGSNIIRARLLAGLTQEQLAKKMETTQPSLARYERGSQMPGNRFLLRVAAALNTNVVAPTFQSLVEKSQSERVQSRDMNFWSTMVVNVASSGSYIRDTSFVSPVYSHTHSSAAVNK